MRLWLKAAALVCLGSFSAQAFDVRTPNQAATFIGTLDVDSGGTGAATLTQSGVLYGNGTSAIGALPAMNNGGLIMGGTSVNPSTGTLTGAASMIVTNANGSITIGVDSSSVVVKASNLIRNAEVDSSSVTKQGNSFNGTSQLVQTTSGGVMPALGAANLTALTAANISAGTMIAGVLLPTGNLTQGPLAASIFPSTNAWTSVDNNFSVPETFQSSATVKANLAVTGTNQFTVGTLNPAVGYGIMVSSANMLADGSGTRELKMTSSNGGVTLVLDGNTGTGVGWRMYNNGSQQWAFLNSFSGDSDANLHIYPYGSGNVSLGVTTKAPATQLEVTGSFSAGSGATISTITTAGAVQLASTLVTGAGTLAAGNAFQVAASSFVVQTDGWAVISGTVAASALSGCGASASFTAGSSDNAGKINTQITGAMSCVFTFKTAAPNSRAPACVVTNETTANLLRATSTSTTVTFTGTTVSGDVIAYLCMGL